MVKESLLHKEMELPQRGSLNLMVESRQQRPVIRRRRRRGRILHQTRY